MPPMTTYIRRFVERNVSVEDTENRICPLRQYDLQEDPDAYDDKGEKATEGTEANNGDKDKSDPPAVRTSSYEQTWPETQAACGLRVEVIAACRVCERIQEE